MMRIAAGIVVAALMAAGCADAEEKRARRIALPVFKIEKGGTCVAPIEEMRRDHMTMLLHQRDRTVRQGLREPRNSLGNCIECHASRETGSVLGKEGFCASCHAYASVSIDCFECHTPLRRQRTAARP
ncbi:MAG: Hdr-like menaquinol oxidoreductase cytochrome c subunit [Betaproteobacteria bacterium]|nr:Hdr-like menaquinol oxidoreductase cytochrome c subunit [Betaproteobacteria bacterium]